MINTIVKLHNIEVGVSDFKIKVIAKHCISAILFESKSVMSDEIYKAVTSDDIIPYDGTMSLSELSHLSTEYFIDDGNYRLIAALYYRMAILTYEYISILRSIKILYNSEMSLPIRFGKLEKIEQRIHDLRHKVSNVEANIDLVKDMGIISFYSEFEAIKKFANTKSFKDIDFVAIDNQVVL